MCRSAYSLFGCQPPCRAPAGRVDVGQSLKDLQESLQSIRFEDTQELRRALQEELDNRNRKSVVRLLRARIQQVQARHRLHPVLLLTRFIKTKFFEERF